MQSHEDDEKKQAEGTIAKKLAEASRGIVYAARELYKVQDQFHAVMPQKDKKTSISNNDFDQKMQKGLHDKFTTDSTITQQYTYFLEDYAGLDSNPFKEGLIEELKKDETTYQQKDLVAQSKKLHEQFASEEFKKTCKALIQSTPAQGWVDMFIADSTGDSAPTLKMESAKPFQLLMRYDSLLTGIIEKAETLIRAAQTAGENTTDLEDILRELIEDRRRINKDYIHPLQDNINVVIMAKKVAYKLVKEHYRSEHKDEVLNAAGELRKLSTGAKFDDIYDKLKGLKDKTGLKLGKYRKEILEHCKEYSIEVLENIKTYVNDVKKKEKNQSYKIDKVMLSLINYMQALETEWIAEIQESKSNKEVVGRNTDKIKLAQYTQEILKKLREEKPLPVDKIASAISYFNGILKKVDSNNQGIGIELEKQINDFASTLDFQLEAKDHSSYPIFDYLQSDKIQLAKCLINLKLPGDIESPSDRRFGQLILANLSILTSKDIQILNTYINMKTIGLPLNDGEKAELYEKIKKIRERLHQNENASALEQIKALHEAIKTASESNNDEMVAKLREQLDQFVKYLKYVVSSDLHPNASTATLDIIQIEISEAKALLQGKQVEQAVDMPDEPQLPLIPTPLSENEELLLAKMELRQALLEKREANQDLIKIKNIDFEYAQLEKAYQELLPSITKRIDKEFIDLVRDQYNYLIEVERKYAGDEDVQQKVQSARAQIKAEVDNRKKQSSPSDISAIESLDIKPAEPVEIKSGATHSLEDQAKAKREKEAALAMLEIRQCLIEKRMVSASLLLENEDLDRDKLLSDETREKYKGLLGEYEKSRSENFDLRAYCDKIGIYRVSIPVHSKVDGIYKTKPMQVGDDATAQKIKVIQILGENGYRKLHSLAQNADLSSELKPAQTTARILYMQYLQQALDTHQSTGSDKPISMEELLGKRGKELYKEAINEELADPAFINAVFLKSVQNFRGPKWAKKLVLWIAGPSSSGKTFATKGMLARIADSIIEKSGPDADNFVVTSDGAVQREASQIRRLTVGTAIELGYRGIKDVDKGLDKDKNKSSKLKSRIEAAAMSKSDLHMAIPDTYTKYAIYTVKVKDKLKKLFKKKSGMGTLQIYSCVESEDSSEASRSFELTVERMGKSRAYLKKGKKHYSITLDGEMIIESKKYDKGKFGVNFELGRKFAQLGRELYRKVQKKLKNQSIDFIIKHDLIFITYDVGQNKWIECDKGYKGDMRMTTMRAFKAWQKIVLIDSVDPYDQFDTWIKNMEGGNKPTLQDPIIECYEGGLKVDHETRDLLKELEQLKSETTLLLKGNLDEDERAQIESSKGKIEAVIIIIHESIKNNDAINQWKDRAKDIQTLKSTTRDFIDRRLKSKMDKFQNWIHENKSSDEHKMAQSVDLIDLGSYLAYIIKRDVFPNLSDEKKQQALIIIDALNNTGTEAEQRKHLQKQIAALKILGIDVQNYQKLYLDYFKAKERDAFKAIPEYGADLVPLKESKGGLDYTKEKLAAYLSAIKNRWEAEEDNAGDYSEGDKSYNKQRMDLIRSFINAIPFASDQTLLDLTKELRGKLTHLTSNERLKPGTNEIINRIKEIDQQFLAPRYVQQNLETHLNEANKLMGKGNNSTKEYAKQMRMYLRAVELEWRFVGNREDSTEQDKEYVNKHLKVLMAAISSLWEKDITLEKIDSVFNQLKTDLDQIPKDSVNTSLTNQTIATSGQLNELQGSSIKHSLYMEWLDRYKKDSESQPDKREYNLESLRSCLVYQINMSKDTNAEQVVDDLLKLLVTQDDFIALASIHKHILTLEDHSKLSPLLLQHTQARVNHHTAKLLNEKQEEMLNEATPEQYVVDKMIEHLKLIQMEWEMKELELGAPTGNDSYASKRKACLEETIRKLSQDVTLEQTQKCIKELNQNLRELSTQPTGLARIAYTVSSRLPKAKKSKGLTEQTDGHVAALENLCAQYIAPFHAMLIKQKELKQNEAEIGPKRAILHGIKRAADEKGDSEIKGTFTLFKSFLEPQKFWVSRHASNDHKLAFDHKEEEKNEVKPVELDGWQSTEQKRADTALVAPTLADTRVDCVGLPSGSTIDYKGDNDAVISESNRSQYIEIGVKSVPDGEVDELKIADAMVRLWVARCGVPVPIVETDNVERMKALATVCKAHNLEFTVSAAAKRKYEFFTQEAELKELEGLKRNIGTGAHQTKPIRLFSEEHISELEAKFGQLKAYYSNLQSSVSQKQQEDCQRELNTLEVLIDQAKSGKLTAATVSKAIQSLNEGLKSLEEKGHRPEEKQQQARPS